MRPSRLFVNRLVLGGIGLALTLVGGWLTVTRTRLATRLPAWWPEPPTGHQVLLDTAQLARLRGEGWWTPTVIARNQHPKMPGVARSRVRVLPRSRRRLEVRLRVWLRPGAPPQTVLPALCAVTDEADESAAPYTTHTRLRLSAVSHRMSHVR